MIKAENVWKIYGRGEAKTIALKNINLEIEEGEFVMIIGPSGCGKSTLLNILALLDVPTKGEVYYKGRKTSSMSENERVIFRRRICGFIFQQFHLIKTLTALENVELPMILDEKNKIYRRKRAEELLELVGLEDRMYHYPHQLSGGQQQRVAIARALANNPKIIFADEPTGNLDSKSGEVVMNILKKLNDNGITIIMVTHEQELLKFASKIIKLRDGEIVEIIK
ncbi:ABC transporter ATP-binding protein [Methanocaldococcus sp. 16A]